MGWLPEADGPASSLQHNCVEPAPDDDRGAIGRGGNSHQMTRNHPLGSRLGKRVGVGHHRTLTCSEHGACILSGAEDDGFAQPSIGRVSVRYECHTAILPGIGAGVPPSACAADRVRELARRVVARPGLILITDKGFAGRQTEADLAARGITLLRPARKNEIARHGEPLLKSVRQLIESVNDTLKGQLDLEAHGGRTFEGVAIRVAQRILAMAAAIWHNNKSGAPVTRSLTAYDH